MILSELINESRIFPDLPPTSPKRLLREMVRRLSERGDVSDPEPVVKALINRERMTSTGIGNGIAVPHCFCGCVHEPLLALAIVPRGAEFHAHDGQPVHFFFLLLSRPENQGQHLSTLSRLVRVLNSPGFIAAMKEAGSDAARLQSVILETEARYEERVRA